MKFIKHIFSFFRKRNSVDEDLWMRSQEPFVDPFRRIQQDLFVSRLKRLQEISKNTLYHASRGDYQEALVAAKEALAYATETKDHKLMGHALTYLAAVHHSLHDFKEEERLLTDAARKLSGNADLPVELILTLGKDDPTLETIRVHLSAVYRAQGRVQESEKLVIPDIGR